jgi:ABC-type dipeptide/oligopeptide/nickel transport system permease component
MARYLLKRFFLTLPALWLVLTLVFLMIHIVPGDPVEQMLGEGAAPRQLAQLRHALGWICLSTRSTGITCGNSGRAILDNPSNFKRPCAKSFSNAIPQLFNLHSSRWLFALRLPFLQECWPLQWTMKA